MSFPQNLIVVAAPILVAYLLSTALYPLYIQWLQSKQIGQFIREEGPQSHAVKAKTPTMGGLLFIVLSGLISIVYLFVVREVYLEEVFAPQQHPLRVVLIVIGIGTLCGLLGFADDYGKITSRSNRGLSAKLRLIVEFLLGGVLVALLYWQNSVVSVQDVLPFPLGPATEVLSYLYLFGFAPFLVAATTNAVNVHDGMDGLAGGTSLMVFMVLTLMLLLNGQMVLAVVPATMVGALGGFLLFNKYPARVFMGDTGSLYIGGLMAAIVFASGLAIWFVPLALIYIAETASVLLQVSYFKLTKEYTPEKPMSKPALIWHKLTKRLPGEGKRLFRMAPLHHHFEVIGEEKGLPEWKVVACFWAIQLLLCMAVLTAYGIAASSH